jgi:hypothetical protein
LILDPHLYDYIKTILTWREEMKSIINPDPDVSRILDADQFLIPRKGLKRWLIIIACLVAAMVIAWVIWTKIHL